jgi:hypothetical protein
MTRLCSSACRIFSAVVLLFSSAALAQAACPAGRAANGQCVDPDIADTMPQTAIIYSQPKISTTHYPVLPSLDWIFRYPNQLNVDQAQTGSRALQQSRRGR